MYGIIGNVLLKDILTTHSYNEPLAQLVEHLTFNQRVEGSSPSWLTILLTYFNGPLVKRLRHRPFTAVTRVRIPYGSPLEIKSIYDYRGVEQFGSSSGS